MKKTGLKIISIFVFLLFAVSGCSSNSDKQMNNNDQEQNSITKIDEISPGTIRVQATVEKIFAEKLSKNEKSPCSKAPCNASLIINDILGRGHSSNALLSVGDTVDVSFAFTTQKTTKELFPNLNKQYPGVSVGDKIVTDLFGGTSLQNDPEKYSISNYRIIK